MATSMCSRIGWIGAIALLAAASALAATQAEFYVATNGGDANPGTEQQPFASIERARDAAREVPRPLTGDIVIHLAPGLYPQSKALVLRPEDSGSDKAAVIYRSDPQTPAVISGGKRVTGWQKDAEGRWKARLDLQQMRQLYVNGKRAVRARGDAPEGVERFGELKYIDDEAGFVFPDGAMADWRNPGDIELGEGSSWSHMIVKVDRIERGDDGRAKVYMKRPYFFLASRKEGRQFNLPQYVENAFELLDEPGEFYFDRKEKMLYYLPREGEDMAQAQTVVPVLKKLLRVEGTPTKPVHDIAFIGLTFADATWLTPNRIGHPDVQANFTIEPTNLFERDGSFMNVQNEYIKSPAHIVLHAARTCGFERCTFTRLGGAGLDLECGASDNTVIGCSFFDISGSAIQVGDVGTADHHPDNERLIVRNNRIVNNFIHDIGVEYEDSVGVFAGYTDGTTIAHNEISNLPYSAISVGWGWGEPDPGGGNYPTPYAYGTPTPSGNNQLEFNHIHHVMQRRDDGGGIYTLSNQKGTVIRGNHIHDNGPGGPGGIYLDEGSGFIEITGNCVYAVPSVTAFNNNAQDRRKTCSEHDNLFDVTPDKDGKAAEIANSAGLEAPFRDLLK